jgi:phenylpyruvate tautomerase PptA (4-oxalocrotonate tautomerase family)
MPIYTCTIAESTLSADTKRALAGEIARQGVLAEPPTVSTCAAGR